MNAAERDARHTGETVAETAGSGAAANEEDRQYLDYIIRYAGEAQAKQQVTGNAAIPLPLSRKAFEKQRESKQIEAEHRAIRR